MTEVGSGVSFVKWPEVHSRFRICRTAWYQGVKAGRFPAPVKLGKRAVAWRSSDLDELAAKISGGTHVVQQ